MWDLGESRTNIFLLFPLLLVMHNTSFFLGNPDKFEVAFRSIVIYAFLLNCLSISQHSLCPESFVFD